MGTLTKNFICSIADTEKQSILQHIASHYGVSVEAAFNEVTDKDAEHLLDYMVKSFRAATSLLMKRHGFIPKSYYSVSLNGKWTSQLPHPKGRSL
jgi:hypothetical protein